MLGSAAFNSTLPSILPRSVRGLRDKYTERHWGLLIMILIDWNERIQLIDESLDALSITTTKRQQPMMISSSK